MQGPVTYGSGENLFKVAVGSAANVARITDFPRKGHPPCQL